LNAISRTLYDKLWDSHVVKAFGDGRALLYIDRHLLHEGCSPHGFEGLRHAGRKVRQPSLTLAVADHVVATSPLRREGAVDDMGRQMIELLEENCAAAGIVAYSVNDPRQGIVHVVGPETGFSLPGSTIVCGDSHTSTHGALGALAFGIGISDVEHVLATQTIVQKKAQAMLVNVDGQPSAGVSSKDLILGIIAKLGVAGGAGFAIEYAGPAISALSQEARFTICNMSIEAGARTGMIAPDDVTFAYLSGRLLVPKGEQWRQAVAYWRTLRSDDSAKFDKTVTINAADIAPSVTWGTNPAQNVAVDGLVPDPHAEPDQKRQTAISQAIDYMGLCPGQRIDQTKIDRVFIGSCTNGRLGDLRSASEVVRGRKVADHVTAWIVPGSGAVKAAAEAEGLDEIFIRAGFEWRNPGCSMCLAMNGDEVGASERCVATSNRNFEGRQGPDARTHLASPETAAASAIAGRIADAREFI